MKNKKEFRAAKEQFILSLKNGLGWISEESIEDQWFKMHGFALNTAGNRILRVAIMAAGIEIRNETQEFAMVFVSENYGDTWFKLCNFNGSYFYNMDKAIAYIRKVKPVNVMLKQNGLEWDNF